MDPLERHREQIGQVKRQGPLRDMVFRFIREGILSGRYLHDQHLAENDIAVDLGVSRTPVREALRKLELEGLVTYDSYRGVRVTHMDSVAMLETYSIMVALEGMVARLAATNASAEELAQLEERLLRLEEAQNQGDLPASTHFHLEFNDLFFRAGRNGRLYTLLSTHQDYIQRIETHSWRDRLAEVQSEHRAILAAIQTGDADGAEAVTRLHVERARTAYSQSSQKEGTK